jgi:multidrug transporter EmrE-like cation transporter
MFWLAVSIGFEIVGDVLAKRASLDGSAITWGATLIGYNVMLLAWFAAVNGSRLITIPGIIWLTCGQLALVAVGCGMFGETLTGPQMAGAGLATAAIILTSL